MAVARSDNDAALPASFTRLTCSPRRAKPSPFETRDGRGEDETQTPVGGHGRPCGGGRCGRHGLPACPDARHGRCPPEQRRLRRVRERIHARDGIRIHRPGHRRVLDRPGPPERARGGDRPAQCERADRKLERLRRRLRRLHAPQFRRRRSDLARLLPLRGRRRDVPELARPRLSGATPRRTRPSQRSARPRRATRSSPGTGTAGCSWARRARTTRPDR